ncbi:MAG TPA: glycoside hydrolase family 3 C-terminal domain-containing protein [Jatrophihabitantaceae bacterium]
MSSFVLPKIHPVRSAARRRRAALRRGLLAVSALLALVAAGLAGTSAVGQAQPAYGAWGSGTLTPAELASLVSQMTPAEEVGMLHGYGDPPSATSPVPSVNGEAGGIAGVPRLGIPPLRFTDGPAGIRLAHVETAMPAPVGLAATWDPSTAGGYGSTVGDAGRATGEDVWLAPMINAVNFVTGGRNFETLGEDPYLAGQLVSFEVQGVQGKGMIAEIKHYAENDFENGRTSTSVAIDDQTLHETELQAFQTAIDAGAGAVMCSYNRINTIYACGNDATLNGVLRGQLGFKGFVTSDWGAVHRVSDQLHGDNIEQPGNAAGTSTFGQQLLNALASGTPAVAATADFPAEPAHTAAEWQATVDTSVLAILTEENNAGLLEGTQYGTHYDPSTNAPYVPPRPDLDSLRPIAAAIAQAIAEQSATLLKNDGALPLRHGDLSGNGAGNGVVVMGPTAIAPYIGGGGSAHVTPYDPVQGPFDALAVAAGTNANLRYVPGYDLDGQVVPSSAISAPDPAEGYPNWTLTLADAAFANQPGLLRQQITIDPVRSGSQPVLYTGSDAAPDRVDQTVDYTGTNTLPANTAWRWSGRFTAPANPGGTGWQLKVFVAHQASSQLFVDGLTNASRRVNINAYPAAPTSSYAGLTETARSHDPANEALQQGTYSVPLNPGQQIHLDLRVVAGANPANIQLRWVPPDDQTQQINAAVAAARPAHKVVIFAYDEGTEGRDRGVSDQGLGLQLPGYQDALIQAVAAANPNTVVVLNTGDPVLMPWASSVNSILEMWYPGQMGGPATSNVLLGAVDPGGKLPVTFPADATHFPTYDPNCTDTSSAGNCPLYPGVVGPSPFLPGATTSFRFLTGMQVNGIYEGYRWYDEHNVTPLFPFGYGLSYTKFDYSKLSVTASTDGGIDVSFRLRNVGNDTGSDTPQVYIGPSPDLPANVQQAVRKLVQFQRTTLGPGQAADLTLHVTPQSLSSWSTSAQQWVLGTGARTVYVGPSSQQFPLHANVSVTD